MTGQDDSSSASDAAAPLLALSAGTAAAGAAVAADDAEAVVAATLSSPTSMSLDETGGAGALDLAATLGISLWFEPTDARGCSGPAPASAPAADSTRSCKKYYILQDFPRSCQILQEKSCKILSR
jgi:hypothetical protein